MVSKKENDKEAGEKREIEKEKEKEGGTGITEEVPEDNRREEKGGGRRKCGD